MESAERHYDEVTEEKEAYADRVAQQEYENALAMGLPYDVAVQQGQYAMDVSEQEFEARVNEKAQDDAERHYDEVTAKKQAYADKAAEQQYENALAMGLPYDVAVQQGQYAMEASEQEFEARVNEKEEYASAVG